MKIFKNIIFILLLATLCVPLLQQKLKLVEIDPLSGAFNLPDTVSLNTESWFSGEFQNLYSPFYEYQIGFRPFFVRLRNQLIYWVYGESTNYVVMAKEKQLYAWNYWAPYVGWDFVGEDSVKTRVRRIAMLKEKLDSMNVPLLVVIGANKVRYMPEFLPDDYIKEEGDRTNYRLYKLELEKAGIPVVDFNSIFLEMKDEIGRAMFPNTGTHWSAYGMGICLDSIISFTNRQNEDALREVRVKGFIKRDSIVDSDIDLSNDLNLIFPWKRQENLFPRIEVSPLGRKAKFFVIGDSFYWNLYQLNSFYESVDSNSHYWYYNNTDIDFLGGRNPVESYDAVALTAEADAVILLATEANLHIFPYDFPMEFLAKAGNREHTKETL